MKLRFSLLAIFFIALSFGATAQSPFKHLPKPEKVSVSPFHRLPNPEQKAKLSFAAAPTAPTYYTAYRFTAAAASFDFINNKVLTGIGYGYNKMRIKIDSSGNSTWYTDFTANINVYAAGNTAPTYSNGSTNIIAFGPSVGIFNKLINAGYVFYPPMNGGKSKSGVILGIDIPLN